MRWEKTFEFSAPVADVWEAFTNREAEHRVWDPEDPYRSGGSLRTEFTQRHENAVLSWRTMHGEDVVSEMTVVFSEAETGTKISITSEGFNIPDFLHQGRLRGWTEMLWDLELYFRTGKMLNRLYKRAWGRLGLSATGDGVGLTVFAVGDDSPAQQAGLQRGDIVVTAAGAPVYEIGDLWLLETVLKPGMDVDFQYFRDGELRSGSGRIAERAAAPA